MNIVYGANTSHSKLCAVGHDAQSILQDLESDSSEAAKVHSFSLAGGGSIMTPDKPPDTELLALIYGACNKTLTPAETEELLLAINNDDQARKLYLDFLSLDAELYWSQSRSPVGLPLDVFSKDKSDLTENALPLDKGSGINSILSLMPNDLTGGPPNLIEPTAMTASRQADKRRGQLKPRADTDRRDHGKSRWMEEILWRLAGTFVFWSILLIVLSPYLSSQLYNSRVNDQVTSSPTPSVDTQTDKSSATLVTTIDCRWQDQSAPLEEGASIGTESLELVSGTAEFLFGNGARVILEGPACLVPQNAGRAILKHGKLAAQVPKRAIGFTIVTPTTEIVDFGTEFGVAVSKDGIVDAAVLVGKVEISSSLSSANGDSLADRSTRVISAGQAVTARVASHQVTIDSADFNEILATSLAKPFESLALLPRQAVAYGVPDQTAGDQRKFHGGVGLDFDLKTPIRVFGLGVFDHLGDGIDPTSSPTVQLWSRDDRGTPNDSSDDVGRQMLASQVFVAGDSSELKLGHRFKALSKPIELQPGSYSIVAYDLANGNPFLETLPSSLMSGSVTLANNDKVVMGQAGGTFACNNDESYYGDTKLDQSFTLDDPMSASGVFTFSNAETMQGKFFIGHFSSSTDDKRREFIGAEFEKVGKNNEFINVRARIYRFDGRVTDDAYSEEVGLVPANGPYRFDYRYEPNHEADANHPGPEGRLVLHVRNDSDWVNSTLYAVNDATHRDAGSAFDSFGMGISKMETPFDDDPASTALLYMDDVTYSGHDGIVNFDVDPQWTGFGNSGDGNSYGWHPQLKKIAAKRQALDQSRDTNPSIVPVGSRNGECKPGTFPTQVQNKAIGYAAGTFEYVVRTNTRR